MPANDFECSAVALYLLDVRESNGEMRARFGGRCELDSVEEVKRPTHVSNFDFTRPTDPILS